MPLEILPDTLDDATHLALDAAVQEVVARSLRDVSDLSFDLQYSTLLNAIVSRGKDMNTEYLDMGRAGNLIDTEEELRSMLASAWKRRTYREIRNISILRAPKPEQKTPKPKSAPSTIVGLHGSLSGAFVAKYRGAAVEGFYEYLRQNEKLFKSVDNPQYYAKFCSIVQSSGTGKSRMLTELSKKEVVVIYMNLRSEGDQLSFPTRDPIPSEILTNFPPTEQEYQVVCYAFFTALFDTLEEYLHTDHSTRETKRIIMEWVYRMCDMTHPPKFTTRADFFRGFSQRYTKVHADYVHVFKGHPVPAPGGSTVSKHDEMGEKITDVDVDKAADKLTGLTLSESNAPSGAPGLAVHLHAAHRRMAESLEKIITDDSDRPKLVIAVDEAHPLTPMHKETYRPADVFCRVVNEYSHRRNYPVWVVFASTTSKVADFSPPNQKYNSDRVAIHGERLFPPYTQLGWDQSAFGLRDVHVENVSKVDYIASYGRPLWRSLKTALTSPDRVLETASSKLCGGYRFDASKTSHVLAVLGQRFGLDVTFGHPDSVEHLESGVASHLRVCLATTLDRNWRFTTYPSEPLLSCAAANDLHEMPGKLEIALRTLLTAVNSGMIDMGQRGELASRLLWLLAKDLFIRTEVKSAAQIMPSEWDEHIADCQMIPVVDWLAFIFGQGIWNATGQASLAREKFQNAYLNFSHWVCMEANIAGSKQGNELGLYHWTRRHWQRTSAVQCFHQQPLVDKVIPIYFKGGPEDAPAESRMSQIFISDKARESKPSIQELANITRRHATLGGDQDRNSDSLPYIAILADLGQPSSFTLTFPERDVDDRCLRIYAAGVDTATYPFLANFPALMKTLGDLVHLQKVPETDTPYREYLNAQVKFGSTATAERMEWERGWTFPE